ncbi:sulfite dehydrogenase (cytochrome) subunit SorA apoprotein [Ectothiorhodosinus mongolicus]|uniref:Sulfite dehydrogenase (Cytochrome) subunit SorA apoprotein n=1 Tax=Ectothiorhodosinus mongolicus TaxID=233100 RepID=A0A1R3VZ79_9GAMM|nr:sulfite oxidase [Ectothiorhodosinus mongolicus]ULX57232.1 molybdopterin containing oxidoreductase [Ectothiorhodosinus mongolicus]SIT70539.1 sulfite dehydrogenase (cytochrome) subunit SorA apoprotein [Ectothiorhodosinus mongolicus]
MKKSGKTEVEQVRGVLENAGARAETLELFDEVTSRRQFLGRSGAALALMGFGAGSAAAMQGLFGQGLVPAAWAGQLEGIEDDQARAALTQAGKEGLHIYNARPVNGEPDPWLLKDAVTPIKHHFIRNNDLISSRAMDRNPQGWRLTIDGEVNRTTHFTLDQLQSMRTVTLSLPIECGGNGRAFFDPPVRGNQWKRCAIGCSEWTGVPLRELLNAAGVKDTAVYTGHYGEEPILGNRPPFSRGIPIDKAMEEHTIVAFKMNGEDLPAVHGYPVRLVVPGWYGSCSHKWLNKITLRDREHDGRGMMGYSYRMPAYPVAPGARPPEEDMVVGGPWLIKSIITGPKDDAEFRAGETVTVTGHAWAGEGRVRRVSISTDFGNTWQRARLARPANKYAWAQFEGEVTLPGRGYYEIWARAEDRDGNIQPQVQAWNPRGYEGNVVHRVPVMVSA